MNSYIKFGSLNCRGLASEHSVTKKEVLVHSMRKLGLDMLFLQETHINTNSTETIEGFCFIYSTSITDAQRKQEAAKEMESDMHPQLTLNMEAQVLFFPQKQKLHS